NLLRAKLPYSGCLSYNEEQGRVPVWTYNDQFWRFPAASRDICMCMPLLSRCAAHAWISSAAVCRFGRQEVETCWGAGHRSAALQFIEVRANPTCGAPHSALSVTSKLTG